VKQLLETVSEYEPDLQKQLIKEVLDQWQANNIRVDDILIFGLKI
jgi:hypothetical protein